MLLVSQGVPMILMGDEMARTQARQQQRLLPRQRAELDGLDAAGKECRTCCGLSKDLIAFRHAHPALRNRWHFSGRTSRQRLSRHLAGTARARGRRTGPAPAVWPSCSAASTSRGGAGTGRLHLRSNEHALGRSLVRAASASRRNAVARVRQHRRATPGDVWEPGHEPVLDDQGGLLVGDRSVVLLVGK